MQKSILSVIEYEFSKHQPQNDRSPSLLKSAARIDGATSFISNTFYAKSKILSFSLTRKKK